MKHRFCLLLAASLCAALTPADASAQPKDLLSFAEAYQRAVAVSLLFPEATVPPALAQMLHASFPQETSALTSAAAPSAEQGSPPPAVVDGFQMAPEVEGPPASVPPIPATGVPAAGVVGVLEQRLSGHASGWVCPIAGKMTHSDDWGGPRIGGRKHEGNDLFAAAGTPIVAIGDGVVRAVQREDTYRQGSGSGNLGGKWVSYFTSNGDRWYHAHMQQVADGLEPGTPLRAGQVIGTVGTSGDARGTPPHDHVEYRPQGGEKVNPYPLLRQLCRR